MRSDFSKALGRAKGIAEPGSYLVNDNGHLNQRRQSYVSLADIEPGKAYVGPKLGPGQYEQPPSIFQ